MSGRAAEAAGGPSEPTWRRVERGERVEATSLYQICSTLLLEEAEARDWFALVCLDFDAVGYERPRALARLIDSLKTVRKASDQALAAALQLEAESREQQ